MSNWFVSSFVPRGERRIIDNSNKMTTKKPNEEVVKTEKKRLLSLEERVSAIDIDHYTPTEVAQLAVSKKRLSELREWFQCRFPRDQQQVSPQPTSNARRSPFLLLSGPPGAGKTIALHLVAKEFNVEVVELPEQVPITQHGNTNEHDLYSDEFHTIHSETQLKRFHDFLSRLNRYSNLVVDENRNHRLLLLEDLPNIFHQKPQMLHHELEHFSRRSRLVPMVFIISNTGDLNLEIRWLPRPLKTRLNFQSIAFKSITSSALVTALARTDIGRNLKSDQLFTIANRSNGDIRCALNNLLFVHSEIIANKNKDALIPTTTSNNSKITLTSTNKRRKTLTGTVKVGKIGPPVSSSSMYNLIARFESLTLTHAMGKVLYAKRHQGCDGVEQHVVDYMRSYPQFDRHRLRNRLMEREPEEVVHCAHMSGQAVVNWSHSNYVDFLQPNNSLASLRQAAECLRVMNNSCTYFNAFDNVHRDMNEAMKVSLVVRGMMFHINPDRSSYLTPEEAKTITPNTTKRVFHQLIPPNNSLMRQKSKTIEDDLDRLRQFQDYRR